MATKPLTEEQRKLAEEHWALIEQVASITGARRMEYGDRVGVGAEGLVDAAATYDPARGAGFKTWATVRIRSKILDAIREGYSCTVRVGRGGRSMGPERYQNHKRPLSLSAGPAELDFARVAATHADLIPARGRKVSIDREMVRKAARTLGLREAIILSMYYGYDWKMKDIGRRLGLSESRVSQTISECLERLRQDRRIREAMTP